MSTQDSFISHLVELRDRLLRAILAVIAVFLCLFYWAKDLYALLAKPLLAALPAGGQMIATDVVGVFLVPVKVAFLVAFVIALPYVLYQAWASVAPEGVAWMSDIDKYLSFVLATFIAFGVTFEVPVVVIVLVRAGVISIEKLKEIRPYVIVGAFVIGAIFTPPDVISQVMLAVPLWFLYELGILLARFVGRSSGAAEEGAAAGTGLDSPKAGQK